MSSIRPHREGTQFSSHYKNLLKHPDQIGDESKMVGTIKNTFAALSSDKKNNAQIDCGTHKISRGHLSDKNVKAFLKFAKSFLGRAEVSPDDAKALRNQLDTFKGVNSRDIEQLKTEMDSRWITALETGGETSTSKINETMKIQLQNVKKAEQKFRKAEKKKKIMKAVRRTIAISSVPVAIVLSLALIPVLGPAAPLVGLGVIFVMGIMALKLPASSARETNHLLQERQELDKLKKYQELTQEPPFAEFMKNNKAEKFLEKGNEKAFYRLIDLYANEKAYKHNVQIVQEAEKAIKPEALAQWRQEDKQGYFTALKTQLEQVNAIRKELGLEMLQT